METKYSNCEIAFKTSCENLNAREIAQIEVPLEQTYRYIQKVATKTFQNFKGDMETKNNCEITYWLGIMAYAEDILQTLQEVMELRKERPDLFK